MRVSFDAHGALVAWGVSAASTLLLRCSQLWTRGRGERAAAKEGRGAPIVPSHACAGSALVGLWRHQPDGATFEMGMPS